MLTEAGSTRNHEGNPQTDQLGNYYAVAQRFSVSMFSLQDKVVNIGSGNRKAPGS